MGRVLFKLGKRPWPPEIVLPVRNIELSSPQKAENGTIDHGLFDEGRARVTRFFSRQKIVQTQNIVCEMLGMSPTQGIDKIGFSQYEKQGFGQYLGA